MQNPRRETGLPGFAVGIFSCCIPMHAIYATSVIPK